MSVPFRAAGQAVVVAHGVLEEAEVPARQTSRYSTLIFSSLTRTKAVSELLPRRYSASLRLRRHIDRQIAGVGLVRL